MTPLEVKTLHGSPTLSCSYCGKTEELPGDQSAQHRHLRLRLLQLRRARDLLEAPLKSFAMIRQSWAFALVIFIPLGGWQAWQATQGGVPAQSAIFALLSASATFGVITGYVGMHRAFSALIRPLLLARPPLEQGLSARCRGCGGELPPVRAPHVECQFCGANNFLDASLARGASELLAAEREAYERRARGDAPAQSTPWAEPSRAFYRWGAAGAAGAFVVGLTVVAAQLWR